MYSFELTRIINVWLSKYRSESKYLTDSLTQIPIPIHWKTIILTSKTKNEHTFRVYKQIAANK